MIALGKLNRCPEDVYRAFDAANYSTLKQGRECAAAMKWAIDNPKPRTDAMALGAACEALIFGEPVAVAPDVDKRTKAGKAEWEAFMASAVGVVVDSETHAAASIMAANIRANPDAERLVRTPLRQIAAAWVDADTGVTCKARIDAICERTLVDLKTTRVQLSDRAVGAEFAAMGYHIQAAFYADGFAACHGNEMPFSFVVVQNRPPYGCVVRRLDDDAIDAGRKWYKHLLRMWKTGRDTGVWPGVPGAFGTLEIPKWERDAAANLGWEDRAAFDDHPF